MSKRALVVGINNFTRPQWRLRGCVNDAMQMQHLLERYFGFEQGEIKILRDDAASNEGIRAGLSWLLSEYDRDGSDVRVLHFSSHGTQVDDQGEDEWERLDEVIVPYDHDWDNPFRDDDLKVFFDTIPEGVSFTFIADCCHSGSIQRAQPEIEFQPRYLLPRADVVARIRVLREERDTAQNAFVATQMAQMLQGVPPDQWADKMQEYMGLLQEQFKREHYAAVPYEKHYLLAACESKQTAADAQIEGQWQGAFTWALGKAIVEAEGNLTYDELIARAAGHLTAYDQRPQLECPTELRGRRVFSPLTC
jgi:hypothetical protein